MASQCDGNENNRVVNENNRLVNEKTGPQGGVNHEFPQNSVNQARKDSVKARDVTFSLTKILDQKIYKNKNIF